MRLISKEVFIQQQTTAMEESVRFIEAIYKTGKVRASVPPDCFIWSGSKKELKEFLENFKKGTI